MVFCFENCSELLQFEEIRDITRLPITNMYLYFSPLKITLSNWMEPTIFFWMERVPFCLQLWPQPRLQRPQRPQPRQAPPTCTSLKAKMPKSTSAASVPRSFQAKRLCWRTNPWYIGTRWQVPFSHANSAALVSRMPRAWIRICVTNMASSRSSPSYRHDFLKTFFNFFRFQLFFSLIARSIQLVFVFDVTFSKHFGFFCVI